MSYKIAYLASPYNNADPNVREERFLDVCRAVAWLMSSGEFVYSPIAMTHTPAILQEMPKNYEFWHAFNCAMIDRCDEMWILCLPGWTDSQGIRAEIKHCVATGKLVRFWDWNPVDKYCIERRATAV